MNNELVTEKEMTERLIERTIDLMVEEFSINNKTDDSSYDFCSRVSSAVCRRILGYGAFTEIKEKGLDLLSPDSLDEIILSQTNDLTATLISMHENLTPEGTIA